MDLDILSVSENTFVAGPRSKIEISDGSNRKKAEERVVYAEERDKKWRHLSSYGLIDNDSNGSLTYYPVNSDQKTLPSRSIGMDVKDREVLKRGSMYQSSEEVRKIQVVKKDRRSVKQDRSDEEFLSFEVIKSSSRGSSNDFVCFPQPTKDASVTVHLDSDSPSFCNNKLFPTENMEFLNLSFRDLLEDRSKISISCSNTNADPAGSRPADKLLEKRLQSKEISSLAGKEAPDFVQKLQIKETKSGALQLCSAGDNASIIYEREYISILPKSFSAKLGTPNTRYYSAREMLKSSPNSRFSPFKKMLDPILKSNTRRNSLLLEPETGSSTVFDAPSLSRHKFYPKSLLNDFSRATQKIENGRVPNGSDHVIKTVNSPAHLHALLRWERNHGASFFEFSVKDPEDVLRAKIWKTDNAFNWVYTFHCFKKKSNSQNNRTKESHDQLSLMIGQMQVSCYLCPEITSVGSFDNSAIIEFILYDIAHARKKNAVESLTVANSLCTESSLESDILFNTESSQSPVSCNSSNSESEPSTVFPWAATELHPNLEIAAIVIQIPSSKKDALKNFQSGDKYKSSVENLRVSDDNCPSPVFMKVVAPSGRHGLPNSEEVGPSSLLDRWRFGGGCDCSGWDMGCPIIVFETVNNNSVASITGTQRSILLYVKGKKEKVPALSITANGKGYYAVDFHAQLSSLQAFSICIAILQGCEVSSAIGRDNDKHKPYPNPLKLLLDEEVRDIVETVTEKKRQTNTRIKQVPASFFLDSPFSPMGRV